MLDRRGFFRHLLAPGPQRVPSPLDGYWLVEVHINPEMRVKVARGAARPVLVQGRWQSFPIKVRNESGTTAPLRVTASCDWLDCAMFDEPPELSGLDLEYRTIRLYSHEAGLREASLMFDVGQGTQDLGFRNEVPILFQCR